MNYITDLYLTTTNTNLSHMFYNDKNTTEINILRNTTKVVPYMGRNCNN